MMLSKKIFGALLAVLVFASCQKEVETPIVEEEEGYIAPIPNEEEDPSEEISPEMSFHMHFDGDMTEEEVDAAWEKGLTEFKEANSARYSDLTDVVATTIKLKTKTGKSYYGTDGSVKATIKLEAQDYSPIYSRSLNNPGDDREGGWDYYYENFAISLTGYVWADYVKISLKGTDGWMLDKFIFAIEPERQAGDANGGVYYEYDGDIWFDSPTSTSWYNVTYQMNSSHGIVTWW